MDNLASNRTVRKLLIPMLLSAILNINRFLNISTVDDLINTLFFFIALTAIFLILIKMAPQVYEKFKNR